jgi:hypothetical protein
MQFSDLQKKQLQEAGISSDDIQRQISRFITGMQYVQLDRPATAGDGILCFTEAQVELYTQQYKAALPGLKLMKFVPASGAATRMFKDLFEFMANGSEKPYDEVPASVKTFAENLSTFPFADQLIGNTTKLLSRTPDPLSVPDLHALVGVLLTDRGMNYGALPKAMLTFHRYDGFTRYAFEEHLVDAALISGEQPEAASIHFTLSQNHVPGFEVLLDQMLPAYTTQFSKTFSIDWSVQNPGTDTVAVDEVNNPLTDPHGNLMLRPGGHGALLYNLNNIDADLIFIRNIDNVASEDVERSNVRWKQLLGGLLLEVQAKVHAFLAEIEKRELTIPELEALADYLKITFNADFNPLLPGITQPMYDFLNRPIRVCGMVKNTGEPGGGPFWVRKGEEVSLQIVESAEINMSDPLQNEIAQSATHFNPVDLVCAVRDFQGEKFDLNRFSDPDTSFISVKSHQGKVLKALEHPGLWNGAMAKWLTLFVEVPLITFNPVKTVNDLLRKEHQGE